MLAPLMPAAEAEVVADKKATYVNDPEQGRHAYGIEGIKDSDASCMTHDSRPLAQQCLRHRFQVDAGHYVDDLRANERAFRVCHWADGLVSMPLYV